MARTPDPRDDMLDWARALVPGTFSCITWWEDQMAHRFEGTASLAKLRSEVKELEAEPYSEVEMADVFISLVIYAHRMGVSLGQAVSAKMAINLTRTWSEPDANGEVQHLKHSKVLCHGQVFGCSCQSSCQSFRADGCYQAVRSEDEGTHFDRDVPIWTFHTRDCPLGDQHTAFGG